MKSCSAKHSEERLENEGKRFLSLNNLCYMKIVWFIIENLIML